MARRGHLFGALPGRAARARGRLCILLLVAYLHWRTLEKIQCIAMESDHMETWANTASLHQARSLRACARYLGGCLVARQDTEMLNLNVSLCASRT